MMLCNSLKDLSKINKDDFIYELKQDGVRAMLHLNEKTTSVFNRNKVNITEKYPELKSIIVPSFRSVLDGEIVILKDKTKPQTPDNIRETKKLPHKSHTFKIHIKSGTEK